MMLASEGGEGDSLSDGTIDSRRDGGVKHGGLSIRAAGPSLVREVAGIIAPTALVAGWRHCIVLCTDRQVFKQRIVTDRIGMCTLAQFGRAGLLPSRLRPGW